MGFIHQLISACPSADFRTWGAAELSLILPLGVHWLLALVYECFDKFRLFQEYKLLRPEEFHTNKVTKLEVVRGVLVNQCIILMVGWIGIVLEPDLQHQKLDDAFGITQLVLQQVDKLKTPMSSVFYIAVLFGRMFVALAVYDTWQYWVHLALHHKSIYRTLN